MLRARRVLRCRPRGLVDGRFYDLLRRLRPPVLRRLRRLVRAAGARLQRSRLMLLRPAGLRVMCSRLGLLLPLLVHGGGTRVAGAMLPMWRGSRVVLVSGDVLIGRDIVVVPGVGFLFSLEQREQFP